MYTGPHRVSLFLSRTMDVCMRKCCARTNCDLAYLIDKNCFSVRCFSQELCKISTAPSITNGDVEISAMRKTVKKEELPEDSRKFPYNPGGREGTSEMKVFGICSSSLLGVKFSDKVLNFLGIF